VPRSTDDHFFVPKEQSNTIREAQMERFKRLALAIALAVMVGPAGAAVQKWEFRDVTFLEGGTLTGSFVLDNADPSWVGDAEITTSFLSATFTGATYSRATLVSVGGNLIQFTFASADGQYSLAFTTAENLGDSVSSGLEVRTFPYGTSVDLDLNNFQNYEYLVPLAFRHIASGSIVAVPEPSQIVMFGAGLLAWAFAGLRGARRLRG
jgi:hypothetical protein